MTVYARSDIRAITVPAEGFGGCGSEHVRPKDSAGRYVQPWALDCDGGCEDLLRADPLWAAFLTDVPESHDEAKSRTAFEVRGAAAQSALMTAAIAQLAGFSQAQIPDVIQRQIAGLKPHVPGSLVCPDGHGNPPGQKFCGECGAAMSQPAAKAALPAGTTA